MEFDRARDRGGDSEIRLRKVGGNSARCLATLTQATRSARGRTRTPRKWSCAIVEGPVCRHSVGDLHLASQARWRIIPSGQWETG